jgi:hypothetical protein
MAELVKCSDIHLARLRGEAAHPGMERVLATESRILKWL